MRRYIVLLLITGTVWAQTDFDKPSILVFKKNLETISFKKYDLIKINGIKYRFLYTDYHARQVILAKPTMLGENAVIDFKEINSFQNFKRFDLHNAFKFARYGAKGGALVGLVGVLDLYTNYGLMWVTFLGGVVIGAPVVAASVGGGAYGFFSKSGENIKKVNNCGFTCWELVLD